MWEGVAAIAGVVLALCSIIALLVQSNKDAEARGRLLQRVDVLEKTTEKQAGIQRVAAIEATVEKLGDRVACVEDGHADANTQFATINATMKAMDDKLTAITTMLERRTEPR
jgi:hypothetical protein